MCSQCTQKTIWDQPGGLDWNAEPPELRALGKQHAERVWLRQMEKIMQESITQLKWEEANLPADEVERRNAERRALIENIVMNSDTVKQAKERRGRR